MRKRSDEAYATGAICNLPPRWLMSQAATSDSTRGEMVVRGTSRGAQVARTPVISTTALYHRRILRGRTFQRYIFYHLGITGDLWEASRNIRFAPRWMGRGYCLIGLGVMWNVCGCWHRASQLILQFFKNWKIQNVKLERKKFSQFITFIFLNDEFNSRYNFLNNM